jgi:hypothetical protein
MPSLGPISLSLVPIKLLSRYLEPPQAAAEHVFSQGFFYIGLPLSYGPFGYFGHHDALNWE